MRKHIVFIPCLFFLLCGLLSGCAIKEKRSSDVGMLTTFTKDKDVESYGTDLEDKGIPLSIISKSSGSEGLYYYEHITQEEKELYNEIYYIVTNLQTGFPIDTHEEETVHKVLKYVLNDHPEIFYLEGYSLSIKKTEDGEVAEVRFTGNYSMNKEKIESYQRGIDQYMTNFYRDMQNSGVHAASDYDLIKYIYEYVIKKTEYSTYAAYDQSIISVMIGGQSVCSGYAKTTQYLLNDCGIEATTVLGQATGTGSHAWNLVKCDGDYYYLDATWGDMHTDKPKSNAFIDRVDYNYLLVTTEEIAKDHEFEDPDILPICTAVKDNYYVREGYYFTGINTQRFEEIFDTAYSTGEEYIKVVLSDQDALDEVFTYMIDEEHIFEYLMDAKITAYIRDDENLCIYFYT